MLTVAIGGCWLAQGQGGGGAPEGSDADSDADTDADTDSDADGDADSDAEVGCEEPMARVAWARRIGGSGSDGIYAMTTLADGTIVIAGAFQGSASFDGVTPDEVVLLEVEYEDGDFYVSGFLSAYSADGGLLWARVLDKQCSFTNLAPGPDGDFILLTKTSNGTLFPFDEEPLVLDANPGDSVVARLSPEGEVQWLRTATSQSNPGLWTFIDARTMPSGIILLTGMRMESLVLGPGDPDQAAVVGGDDQLLFTAALDADGTILWLESPPFFGPNGHPWLAEDGSVIAAGGFQGLEVIGEGGPVEKALVSLGGWDGWLARFGASGNLMWAESLGGPLDDNDNPGGPIMGLAGIGESMVVAGLYADGAVFGLGGPNATVLHTDLPDNEPADWPDAFLARYAANGDLDWAVKIPGDEPVRREPHSLAVRDNGQIAAGGTRRSYGLLLDGFSPSGEHCWSMVGTSDCPEAGDFCRPVDAYRLAWAPDGQGLVAVGSFQGTATLGQGWPGEVILTATPPGEEYGDDYPSDGVLMRLEP